MNTLIHCLIQKLNAKVAISNSILYVKGGLKIKYGFI